MTPSHIEHIGIAVTNLDEAIRYWEDIMGLKCYAIEEVKDQKVKTAFFRCGDVKIELLEPTSPDSTIASFIEKNGGKGGMHHMAFAMENTDQALNDAKEKGVRLIDYQSRPGAEGLKIGFLHPKSTLGVLTEFCCK
jgi:methylmalonyl-CoA/ethylmalonyl-CoA epimerase